MTGIHFRRRQHAMAQRVAAFFLAFMASLAAADPAPPPSQPGELPVASTTADTRTGSSGKTPLQQQPVAVPEAADLDAAVDIAISPRFNELRRELLDYRVKTVDWWLAATAIFLTLLGIVAVAAGYLGFKRFREIEAEALRNVESSRKYAEEAWNLVGEIKERRDEVNSLVEGMTAEDVQNDPDEAQRAAKNVREDPSSSPISQAVAAAVLFQWQGKIEEAIEKWRAVAVISEGSDQEPAVQAWFSVGYLSQKHKTNALETAIDAYDRAIRLKPDYAEAYSNRGVAKSDLGRHDEAIADYDEAIRLKPDYAEVYSNLGDAKNDLGWYEDAIADCDKAIRLKPDLAEAYSNRGVAKRSLGRYEAAIADCDEAIRLKPDLVEVYYNRGEANISLNRADEARRDFETAITLAREAGDETLASDAERALKQLLDEQAP